MGELKPAQPLWLDLLGAEVRYYDVDGMRTRVIVAGAGDPVVLLHGMTGHAEVYARNIPGLSAKYRVYAVDMLGHGFSAKDAPDFSVAALADHLYRLLNVLGLTRVNLVGQSLGGWVATHLALHHPEVVNRLVLATTAGLEAALSGEARRANTDYLSNPSLEGVRRRLEWMLFDRDVITEEMVELRYRLLQQPLAREALLRMISETPARNASCVLTKDRLAGLSTETLVLWTSNNPTTTWKFAQNLAETVLGNAAFYLMEKASHWPQYERPDEFNQAVDEFLATGVTANLFRS